MPKLDYNWHFEPMVFAGYEGTGMHVTHAMDTTWAFRLDDAEDPRESFVFIPESEKRPGGWRMFDD